MLHCWSIIRALLVRRCITGEQDHGAVRRLHAGRQPPRRGMVRAPPIGMCSCQRHEIEDWPVHVHSGVTLFYGLLWICLCWEQAPQPTDRQLSLEAAGGEILAVLRFEGSATREATEAAVAKLRQALSAGLHQPPLGMPEACMHMAGCTCSLLMLG